MPFLVIEGTFHLVNKTKTGQLTGFQPDGDSIHFKPKNRKLLDKLEQLGRPYKLTNLGSTQLRFEGIDALELHYQPEAAGGKLTHQPRPLADQARDLLTGLLGMNPVPYVQPKGVTVKAPAPKDAVPGFILSRALEANGRPVSFAFAGKPPAKDGADFNLTPAQLKKSLNYQLLLSGHAYPLFYDGLFSDLRSTMALAAEAARAAKKGLWKSDASRKGLSIKTIAKLENDGVLFPKLFRRLTTYLTLHPSGVAGFLEFIAKGKKEQVILLKNSHPTHFDNLLELKGTTIKLTVDPEEFYFISEKSLKK